MTSAQSRTARGVAMMRQYELVERVQKYDPSANEALLNRAYVYAMQAHGHQKRASGDPYFSHPLEVAAILTELKLDDATIAAALLHDVIEDTDVTRAEIDQKFGKEIGALVEGLTKIKKLDLVTKKAEQAENFRKLLVAISSDIRVLLIKLADRLHNMRTLEHMKPESRRRDVRGDARDLCAAGRPHGHAGACARSSRSWPSSGATPRPTRPWSTSSTTSAARTQGLVEEIGAALKAKLAERRPRGRGLRPREEALLDLAQDGEPADLARAALRHLRLPRRRATASTPATARSASCIRPGARCPAASRTTSRRRSRTTTSRSTPPSSARAISASSCRSAPREMHQIAEYGVAAHALYKDGSTPATAMAPAPTAASGAQGEPLHLAAPAGRHAARGRQPRGVPRAHQARAVPGPGVLLHAEGPPDRPAARRHAASISPMPCTPTSATPASAPSSTAASCRSTTQLRNGDEVEILIAKGADAARRLGSASPSPARRASSIRRAARDAVCAAVLRARPPPARLRLPADRPGLHRRQAQEGVCRACRRSRSRRCTPPSAAASCR